MVRGTPMITPVVPPTKRRTRVDCRRDPPEPHVDGLAAYAPERRLLLTNHHLDVPPPPRIAIQTGLNFADSMPQLLAIQEMGEDALRALRVCIEPRACMLPHVAVELPPLCAAPNWVNFLAKSGTYSSIFARPKSSTFTLPSGGSLMFPGFGSRMDDPLGMRRLHRLGVLQSILSVPQSGMIAASLRCRVLADGIEGSNRILIGRIQGPSLTGRNQEWRGATAKRSTPPARRAWSSRWHPSMTGRGGEGTRGTPSLGWRGVAVLSVEITAGATAGWELRPAGHDGAHRVCGGRFQAAEIANDTQAKRPDSR